MRVNALRESLAAALALVLAALLVAGLLALTVAVSVVWYAFALLMLLGLLVLLPTAIVVGAVAFPVISVVVRALGNVRRRGGLPPTAVPLPAGRAPHLWKIVTDLAQRMETPAPTWIWLTPDASASVHESRRLLRPPGRTRHLCVGAPLLEELTVDQLRAVLCHELAHYARRHAAFTTLVYRGSAVLRHLREELDAARLPESDVDTVDSLLERTARLQSLVFRAYAFVYDLATLAVRRHHEYEADRIAATLVGSETMADTLRAAHAVQATHAAQPAQGTTRGSTRGTTQAKRRPRADSHPPLEARLAALDRLGTPSPVTGDRTPARELLGHSLLRPDEEGPPRALTTNGASAEVSPRRLRLTPALIPFVAYLLAALVFGLLPWAEALPSQSGLLLFPLTLLLVAMFQPMDDNPTAPPRPRRIRPWINSSTALVVCLAVFIAIPKGPEGLVAASLTALAGWRFFAPHEETTRTRFVMVMWFAASAFGSGWQPPT